MCVYTTTDPPGIRLFLRLPASRTSPDTRPLSKEERWHWSHSGVKVTFFHRTWRSHRLPHTPISLLFFLLSIHTTFFFVFFLSHLNMPFPAFFPCYFPLHIWAFYLMFECWPPLGPKLFCTRLFDNGGWLKVSEWYRTLLFWLPWGGYKVIFTFDLLVFHCFKGFIFFIKLHWKSEVVWLDVQFEVVVSRGQNMNVEWSYKRWLQRAKTEDTSACLWTFYRRVRHEEVDMFKCSLNAFLG